MQAAMDRVRLGNIRINVLRFLQLHLEHIIIVRFTL